MRPLMAGGIGRVSIGLLALVPLSLVLKVLGASDLVVFAAAGLAVIPLAHLMGVATDEIGKHAGPGIGGFLNATFGNATEMIIALAALIRAGSLIAAGDPASLAGGERLVEVVKASITGSIIGNILLVLGLSMLVGGLKHRTQTFSVKAAEIQVTMMALAVAALVMPELFQLSYCQATPALCTGAGPLPNASLWISGILLVGYALGLLFSLHTHKDIFNPVTQAQERPRWNLRFAIAVLVGATALVALVAEVLVGAVEGVTQGLGLTEIFMGVMIIAIIGNAAEHGTAVIMAHRNKMDLSVGIATISSAQVALFVTPVLVLASFALGAPMTLAFEVFELVAIILSVVVVSQIAKDGESNWYEGVLLLLLYAIIGVGFYFHPP